MIRTLALPAWAAFTAAHPRLRPDWKARWGLEVAPAPVGAIWVHAASVGEVSAAHALLGALGRPALLTVDTDTGIVAARALGLPAVARPVDHPWTIAPVWADVRPSALVFVEGAWWPELAATARRAGIPVVRAGAKVGPRTRYAPAGLYRRWARASLVLARDDASAAWFRGHQDAPVEVIGDLKLDLPPRASPLVWRRPFVVGASTRPGDERALLAARPHDATLLLAPRHPERWPEVADLLRGYRWVRRTSIRGEVPDVDVVLLDTLGELGAILVDADAVFVGGTFDAAIGGHSAAEAARAGVPVVAGPHRWANPSGFVDAVDTSVHTLASAFHVARTRPRRPMRSGAAARAAARIGEVIGAPAPESSPRPWASIPWPRRPRRRERLEVPVVAVGSENARGSGKTSTARWIAARLAAAGHRVGVVAHGYRRGGPVAAVGDEGALFVADGHLVAVGSARPLVDRGVSVIVLDDGAHDDGLVHDVVIGVVDARFPTGRGPLPRGEGRRIARFDGIVVHHARPDLPYAAPGIPTVFAERRSGPWMRDGAVSAAPEGPVAAFAGIGRPADLLDTIGVPVERFRALPDHAPIPEAFARELTAWADGRPLVCTEKDAVRAPAWLRPWWRRLELVLPREVDAWLPSMS